MKNPASAAQRERHGGVTNGRPIEIKCLRVPAHDLVFEREEIGADAKVPGVAKLSEDLGVACVSLKRLRQDHRGSLYLPAVIEEPRNPARVLAAEVVEPAPEVLAFE